MSGIRAGSHTSDDTSIYALSLKTEDEVDASRIDTAISQPATPPGVFSNDAGPISPSKILVYRHKRRRRYTGRLFSVKNNGQKRSPQETRFSTAARTDDYEQKYPEDAYGEETFPEARVWRVYNDEAEMYDMERIEIWRDALDVLLVFIGLFSAIVTTFVVQASQALLQPEYGRMTAIIAFEMLRTLSNSTISPLPLDISDPRTAEATPSSNDNLVNLLWFTSLAISLSTGLLTVLVKQWLYHYTSSISGTSRDRARIRQFRHLGLEAYRVPLIIDVLPILLHIALAIFLVGLAIFLRPLNSVTFSMVVGITGVAYLFCMVSFLIPLFDQRCPYKSPLSFYTYHIHRFLQTVPRQVVSLTTNITFQPFQPRIRKLKRQIILLPSCIGPLLIRLYTQTSGSFRSFFHLKEHDPRNQRDRPTLRTLTQAEIWAVAQSSEQLDLDAIIWLYAASANSTVCNIALEAFGGLAPSDAKATPACHVLDAHLYDAVKKCFTSGDILSPLLSGMEKRHDRLLRALCLGERKELEQPYSILLADMSHEQEPQQIFARIVSQWARGVWDSALPAVFPPGPQSSVVFPLPIWATVLKLARHHMHNHPIIIGGIISTGILDPTFQTDTSDMGAVRLEVALRNPFVHSLALQYLGIPSTDSVHALGLLHSYLSSLIRQANDGQLLTYHSYFPHSVLYTSADPLLSNLYSTVFKSLANQVHESLHSYALTRNILHDFFVSGLTDRVSWETLADVTKAWDIPFGGTVGFITTPSMIHHVLAQFRKRDPPSEDELVPFLRTVDNLGDILFDCLSSPDLARATWESISDPDIDLLPLDIESLPNLPLDSEPLGQTSCVRLFWSGWMCRIIVDKPGWLDDLHQDNGPFEDWLRYLHKPQRLSFLCRQLLSASKAESLLDLCLLQPQNINWPPSFKSLLLSFDDSTFMNSMVDRHGFQLANPRTYLSWQFGKMKAILQDRHDLSDAAFDIPHSGEEDHLVVHMPNSGSYSSANGRQKHRTQSPYREPLPTLANAEESASTSPTEVPAKEDVDQEGLLHLRSARSPASRAERGQADTLNWQ